MKRILIVAAVLALVGGPVFADSFINGGFELGNSTGWTTGTGFRGSVDNPTLQAAMVLPGGALYNGALVHSSIVTPGLDPQTGNQLNMVYADAYSWLVEDTTSGGYASGISQRVNAYSNPNIFFAWAAVLEGAHGPTDAATVKITLTDLTLNSMLINREYNAASSGGGVDARFQYYAPTNFFWTPWQIEQLTLPAGSIGHDFLLSILASDCQPTGHAGYLYLDGFGNVTPPTGNVPEPASMLLLGTGLVGLVRTARRSMRK